MIGISYTVLVTYPAYVLFTTIHEVAITSVQNKETHLKKVLETKQSSSQYKNTLESTTLPSLSD